ncbi:DUF1269 domain-containing protein [Saccharopolyspora sp. HNM0983]|uniref:DUF1269 domain-containing protein n=1 Tax=Saccharopolyspora montiporae TaxID=2781240 RepID=A0A929B5Y7_9PSEU|nr:DUF1269 domain-containing protein [Saccharopolyspora sp. HNM0983]MBE9372870.1 DUF1269 domain-containing protein [Saccharopolyspora sp. HNM0983]
MATLTAWKFDSATGAEEASSTVQELAKEELIKIYDAATVSWPESSSKPKTRQLHHLAAGGALGGSFWGLLFGLIFFVPLLGAAIGAATGALAGSLTDVGIDDDFIRKTQDKVVPGTSALFLLTSDAVLDKVRERVDGTHFELIHTNLSNDQEAALRKAFEGSEAA